MPSQARATSTAIERFCIDAGRSMGAVAAASAAVFADHLPPRPSRPADIPMAAHPRDAVDMTNRTRSLDALKSAISRQRDIQRADQQEALRDRLLTIDHRVPHLPSEHNPAASPATPSAPYFLEHPVDILLDRLHMEKPEPYARFYTVSSAILTVLPVAVLVGLGIILGPRDLWFTFAGSLLGLQLARPYTLWRKALVQAMRDGSGSPFRPSMHLRYRYWNTYVGGGIESNAAPYRFTNWDRTMAYWGTRRLQRGWRRVFRDRSPRQILGPHGPLKCHPSASPRSEYPQNFWQRHLIGRLWNRWRAACLLRRAGKLLIKTTLLGPYEHRALSDLPALYMAAYYDLRYFKSPTRMQKRVYTEHIACRAAVTRPELAHILRTQNPYGRRRFDDISIFDANHPSWQDASTDIPIPTWWKALSASSPSESVTIALSEWCGVIGNSMPQLLDRFRRYLFDVIPIIVSASHYRGPALLYVFDAPTAPHYVVGYPPLSNTRPAPRKIAAPVREFYRTLHDGFQESGMYGTTGILRSDETLTLATILERSRMPWGTEVPYAAPPAQHLVALFERPIGEYVLVNERTHQGQVWTTTTVPGSARRIITEETTHGADTSFSAIVDSWISSHLDGQTVGDQTTQPSSQHEPQQPSNQRQSA